MALWFKDNKLTVWKVIRPDDEHKPIQLQVSTSSKNKVTGEWSTDFSGYVAVRGKALDMVTALEAELSQNGKKGVRIVADGNVTTFYSEKNKATYTNYMIYAMNFVNAPSASADGFMDIPEGLESDIPFK